MRIYSVHGRPWAGTGSPPAMGGAASWEQSCARASELGFDTVLTRTDAEVAPFGEGGLPQALEVCSRHGLDLYLDVEIDPADQPLQAWIEILIQHAKEGAAGFLCRNPSALPAMDWCALVAAVHQKHQDCVFLAWTPGLSAAQIKALADCDFTAGFLSLPWWDYRSLWLMEERDRLCQLGGVIAPLSSSDDTAAQRALWTAAFIGDGLMMPAGLEDRIGTQTVIQANRWLVQRAESGARVSKLSGPRSAMTAVFRGGDSARLLLLNPDAQRAAPVDRGMLASRMPASYILPASDTNEVPETLEPNACAVVTVSLADPVSLSGTAAGLARKNATPPLDAPRIAIESITPNVDAGQFPVKRTVGERVVVQADVFVDGHEHIAVQLLWRPADEAAWRRAPMQALGNDRWQAAFVPERLGRHCYTVQAWRDAWHTYADGLRKKVEGGQDVSLEAEEGRMLIAAAIERVQDDDADTATTLAALLRSVGRPQDRAENTQKRRPAGVAKHPAIPAASPEQIKVLLSSDMAAAMAAADDKPFEVSAPVHLLTVDRREARFASWYELFPRSYSPVPGQHGRFVDVIARLPAIRDMGFDVLYMPPIHPIGMRNRKGRNNALQAGPEDPGSPYAIGSAEGGHDAVHPELGTLDDFQELLRETRAHGMEIALDFAIQCSPDHPWLAQHPEWFDWRADGSLRYAENPPKRYEDIVNPDFYTAAGTTRQASLWRALRDVVVFWVEQGVRIFRVDNPHTKPLPFWQWLIAQVQASAPDVLFLSEAFTRPKMMYRLAKVGFTQSYTYFTWRNDKPGLQAYLTELNTAPVADFFRPNFFVNTPDINPHFLQTSGRPGFLIRAALATTMSGLWGMYSGFELCEADSLPGKEEYRDSEKYQFRAWDWDRPENIINEISRLNHIRRSNPALQTHLGIRFHRVDNDQIVFFSKATEEGDNIVLVAISLDPFARQGGTLEIPVDLWGGEPDQSTRLRSLFDDGVFVLQGDRQYVELGPDRPFLLWSVLSPA